MLGRLYTLFAPKAPRSTLREQLIANIQNDYINAWAIKKWVDWIGQTGIKRAKDYITWLNSSEVNGLNDYELASLILKSFEDKAEASAVSLAGSKNLRMLVACETYAYLNNNEPSAARQKNEADFAADYSQNMLGGSEIPGYAERMQIELSIAMIRRIVKRRALTDVAQPAVTLARPSLSLA